MHRFLPIPRPTGLALVLAFAASSTTGCGGADSSFDPDVTSTGKADQTGWLVFGHFRSPGLADVPDSAELRDDGCVALTESSEVVVIPVNVLYDARYDIVITAYQDVSGPNAARMEWSIDDEAVAQFDVGASAGDWDVFYARADMEEGQRELAIRFGNPHSDPDAQATRRLVLCRWQIDDQGPFAYTSLPDGELRMAGAMTIDETLIKDDNNGTTTIGTMTTDVTCVLKGHNPGRPAFDCEFEFHRPPTPSFRLPRTTARAVGLAGPEKYSGFWDRYFVQGWARFEPPGYGEDLFQGYAPVSIQAGNTLTARFDVVLPYGRRLNTLSEGTAEFAVVP